MPLIAADIKARLKGKVVGVANGMLDNDAADLLCQAIAETIQEELTTNAIVTPGGTAPFSNSAGPVVGTGVIT